MPAAKTKTSARTTLAILALVTVALLSAQEPRSSWRFAPVDDIEDGEPISGLSFRFEAPCASTAKVTVEGWDGDTALKVEGEVSTDQHGDRVLHFAMQSLSTLRITKLTLVCGRYTIITADPVAAHYYDLCGGKK
jgi:hypothetical protein